MTIKRKISVFISDSGKDVFEEWLSTLSVKAITHIRAIIDEIKINQLEKPFAKKLRGCKNIWELLIRVDNVQYRPFGCKGPEINEFTLLCGATHKQNRYNPTSAIETAEKRCKLVFENRRYKGDYRR